MSLFNIDLKRGIEIEEIWFNILNKTIPDLIHVKGKVKEWDLYSKEKDIGIEIKFDPKSEETGNIVVEIEMGGKLSGLSTTKAKYWIFDTGEEYFITRVTDLKTLVKQYKPATFTGPGDYHSKKAYLIRKQRIREISITLEDMLDEINNPKGLDGFC